MTPASLIKTVRVRHGLTQRALASAAGTSQPVISAYEAGRRDPTYTTLRKLVEAAGDRLAIEAQPLVGDVVPAGDAAEHGRRLLDVLSLADAIPTRPRPTTLDAPRMVSR